MKINEILMHAKILVNLEIIILYKKLEIKVHDALFNLYAILENASFYSFLSRL